MITGTPLFEKHLGQMRKQRAKLGGLLQAGRCPTGPRRAELVPGACGCEGSCGEPALVSPRGRDSEQR